MMKSNSLDNGTVMILQQQFKINSNNNHNIDSNNENSIREKQGSLKTTTTQLIIMIRKNNEYAYRTLVKFVYKGYTFLCLI